MKWYLVVQPPKYKFRSSVQSGVAVVCAESKAEAVRLASEKFPDYIFNASDDLINKPVAYEFDPAVGVARHV